MQYNCQHKATGWGMLFILLCIAGSITGCKKLVDAGDPVNTITTDKTFSTNALANSALAGIFSQLMNNSGSMIFSNGATTIYAGMSSDELENFSGTTNVFDYQFFTNQLTTDNLYPSTYIWTPAYKIIYNCNGVIEGIAASQSTLLTDSVRKVLTGEAKFVRAFCYFYLTNFFGDVPLVLTTDYTQTVAMAKTSQATIYNQMVQDLVDAKSLLLSDYSTAAGERIRPNKWAATALLARVYLYQQNWAAAEAAASEVIANSQYSIVSDLSKVFLLNTAETIWAMQQNVTKSPKNITWEGLNFVPPFRWSTYSAANQAALSSPAIFNSYAALLIPPYFFSKQMATAFEPGDKRKAVWVDSVPSPAGSVYQGRIYYFPFKYTSSTATTGTITQYYTVLRLAEQYLIRAEARAQQGTNLTGAASDLNVLRTRAGLANTTASTQADLLTAVAQERRIELMAEWGHRLFDLKRTGKASSVLSSISDKQPWSDNHLLYPIPILEITNDHNLLQNPGY